MCACLEFKKHEDAELLARLKHLIIKALPDEEVWNDEEDSEILTIEDEPKYAEIPKFSKAVQEGIFMGKVSRSCKLCGEVKMYKDFNGSYDPATPCNYCAWEEAELGMIAAMTDKERPEILETEESIIENERAYEDELERQEMIEEFLKGLDD